jgi:hypothetical protein
VPGIEAPWYIRFAALHFDSPTPLARLVVFVGDLLSFVAALVNPLSELRREEREWRRWNPARRAGWKRARARACRSLRDRIAAGFRRLMSRRTRPIAPRSPRRLPRVDRTPTLATDPVPGVVCLDHAGAPPARSRPWNLGMVAAA